MLLNREQCKPENERSNTYPVMNCDQMFPARHKSANDLRTKSDIVGIIGSEFYIAGLTRTGREAAEETIARLKLSTRLWK